MCAPVRFRLRRVENRILTIIKGKIYIAMSKPVYSFNGPLAFSAGVSLVGWFITLGGLATMQV